MRWCPDILARTAACDPDVLGFGYDRSDPERPGKRAGMARRLAHAAPLSVLAIRWRRKEHDHDDDLTP